METKFVINEYEDSVVVYNNDTNNFITFTKCKDNKLTATYYIVTGEEKLTNTIVCNVVEIRKCLVRCLL